MKYGVNRKVLLITAGVVWIIAGANILRIGIMTWLTDSQYWLFKIGEATVVFLLFFLFVFKRLYYKHTKRIGEKKKEKNCPFSFFDVKGWIVMVFMITFGITMRSFPYIAGRVYFGVLYRTVACAHVHRSIVYTLLVDKPERQSLYSAARRMKVVAPMVTMAPSSMRIRSLSPKISLFRKVPVRLGASRKV